MSDLATTVLSYGDNLDILRRYLPDASVDLVYLGGSIVRTSTRARVVALTAAGEGAEGSRPI